MAEPRYQHSIQLTQDLEDAWLAHQGTRPGLSFNAFICDLIREALCVTTATSLTIP